MLLFYWPVAPGQRDGRGRGHHAQKGEPRPVAQVAKHPPKPARPVEKEIEKVEKREVKIEKHEAKAREQARKREEHEIDREHRRNHPRPVGTTPPDRPMRFRGMDRNHDGIITRNEWRGNDRSFSNHDWNHDGVLSGDEVRSGAHQPIDFDARFRRLDLNHDGVVSRAEWRGELRMFDRLDTNHDGVLSRAEFSTRR